MGYTILVAEDDEGIVDVLKMYLENSGYNVITANDGQQAYDCVLSNKIDMAILDIMMPKMDGYKLTAKIREKYKFPIIILTACVDDSNKILGLNIGADDYLEKPFNPLEVLARVKSCLRRAYDFDAVEDERQENDIIKLGELSLDTGKMILKKNDEEIIITPNEYKILNLLMSSPGRVYTKSQMCEEVNGEFYDNYENAIMVHISHLRDKIEKDPKRPEYIKNIRGIGYKMEYNKNR